MKNFSAKFLFAVGLIFFVTNAFAGKPAILCRKGTTFEEAVGKLNSITIDPQWPVEINKISSTSQTTSINAKSIKYDMANFKVSEYEETIKNGSVRKKEQAFQACVPIEFD